MRDGKLVRLLYLLPAALLLAYTSSCDSAREIATAGVYFDVPGDMGGGRTATWRVNMPNLVPPLSVDWDFGGGATPNTFSTSTEFDSSAVELRMLNSVIRGESMYRLRVEIIDGLGDHWTETVIYSVSPTNVAPDAPHSSYDATTGLQTITVADANGDVLNIVVTPPEGLSVEPAEATIGGGAGEAVFQWSAVDPLAGGSGTASFTVVDGHGGVAEGAQEITVAPTLTGTGTGTGGGVQTGVVAAPEPHPVY